MIKTIPYHILAIWLFLGTAFFLFSFNYSKNDNKKSWVFVILLLLLMIFSIGIFSLQFIEVFKNQLQIPSLW